jgi:hypothetical protein
MRKPPGSRRALDAAVLVVLPACGFGCAAPGGAGSKAVADEIWSLENDYWVQNRDAAYERIVSAWHDRFLGWPGSEPKPIGKEDGPAYVRRSFPKPGSFAFEIEPAGIRAHENIVVNHYTVHLASKDERGQDQTRSMRITHTWIREGGTWKLLGGMSCGG